LHLILAINIVRLMVDKKEFSDKQIIVMCESLLDLPKFLFRMINKKLNELYRLG